MFTKLYYFLHKKLSKPEERGEYSAGLWQDAVREKVFSLCEDNQCKILEVGCGEGLFLSKIAAAGKYSYIYGVDIWETILMRAQDRFEAGNINNAELTQADAASLPFKDNSFDTVVCINVFFNLPAEDAFQKSLKEISRVCKKGGAVIFDIRNSQNILLYLKYKLAKYYDETVKNLPLRTYNFNKVKASLEKCGFEIESRNAIGFPHNRLSPIFVIKAKRK